ncbi:hypothetical protein GA0061098_103085 [Bradyrhizobium shewense]|uniref:Uncharacterized protein n=1 Tax=Bradyrhizobium shewense TaxID=1761772 RepID=A0A1C3XRD3_9BRAD|nr:hypothetical protein GA0061098_103085 [Bradyrhizobium shewense]
MLPDFPRLHVQRRHLAGAELPINKASRPPLRDGIEHRVDCVVPSGCRKPYLAFAAVSDHPNNVNPLHPSPFQCS